tara:strand:+ start:232 stop:1152 length:921 start_codon:yes stop_codon:yes gene_type:complete
MSLSIVIPVFNEKESLPDLIKQLEKILTNFPLYEVIFIDDGSSDGSNEYLQEQSIKNKSFKVVEFYRNFGKAAALSEGFKIAKGDYIITMDADLQDDPAEIPNLIDKLNDGWDLVSGWKKVRNDPLSKTLPSKIFNLVTRILTGVKIHDFNCGLKGYKKVVIKSLDIYGGRHRYIPALAGQKKFKITEIIVNHRSRKYGTTKYGGSRIFHGFFDLITILFLDRYDQQPLHLFGSFGLFFLSFGLIAEVIVLYFKYKIGDPFSMHIALLLFGIMLIVIGIQFFSIGLLAELLAGNHNNRENRIKNLS